MAKGDSGFSHPRAISVIASCRQIDMLSKRLRRVWRQLKAFKKVADYLAFEKILHEALEIHDLELFSYQLMRNHNHLVLRPLVDGEIRNQGQGTTC